MRTTMVALAFLALATTAPAQERAPEGIAKPEEKETAAPRPAIRVL